MATLTKLGPAQHGVRLSDDEFRASDYEPGFRYELIDGRLFVSPEADLAEDMIVNWLLTSLMRFHLHHSEIINYVTQRARVFVPYRLGTTCPQPDLSAYANVPFELPPNELGWEDLEPLLVVEVMTGDAWKDLDRNTKLYLLVPGIREYWVIDARDQPDGFTLIQHKKRGERWVVRRFPLGSTFTTKLLPGFSLVVDPRQR